jgi:predicted esterase
MLHGLGGFPQSACAPFVNAATDRGWLVCPRGEDACGDGARWRVRPEDDGRVVEASLDALAREHPDGVDASSRRVLVGFSLGGIAAVRIAQSEKDGHGRYVGLVVIASQVHPDGTLLARAGVKRVVLAAGDLDMTSAPLQADARALNRVGLPTRFVSLGRVGHGYPADMADIMSEPIAWVAGAAE